MFTASLLGGIAHGFTTRDEGDLRSEGARAVVARLGGDGDLRNVRQVHGQRVVDVSEADGVTEADAIVSDRPGVVIGVRVADCVPILIAAPGVVAAVHAGWRGTAADVTRAALAAVRERAAAGVVRAAIGPAICVECYEVGPEVVEAVASVAPGDDWRRGRHVDLGLANERILVAEGVQVERISVCTRCDPRLWSHRRDGAPQRQGGVIRL